MFSPLHVFFKTQSCSHFPRKLKIAVALYPAGGHADVVLVWGELERVCIQNRAAAIYPNLHDQQAMKGIEQGRVCASESQLEMMAQLKFSSCCL